MSYAVGTDMQMTATRKDVYMRDGDGVGLSKAVKDAGGRW